MGYASLDLPPLHVLVVEDDRVESERLTKMLEDMGCRVDLAANGAAAVRRTLDLRPDVVLMDIALPILDGWAAMRRIREDRSGHRPYLVAISISADARTREMAFEAGCDEFIVKPHDVRGSLRAYVVRRRHRSIIAE